MWNVIGWIIWIVTPRVMRLPPWQSRKQLLEIHALQTKGFRQWQKHKKLVRRYAMVVRARTGLDQRPNPLVQRIEKLTQEEDECYQAVVRSEQLCEELRIEAIIAAQKFLNARKDQIQNLIEKERERQVIITPAESALEEKWKNVRAEEKASRIAKLEGLLPLK